MFDSLLGNMDEFQDRVREKLAEIEVSAEAGGGAVKVRANGQRKIIGISIDPEKVDTSDPEMMEDLLLIAINEALSKAAAEEEAITKEMMKDMLPPGLDGLFG